MRAVKAQAVPCAFTAYFLTKSIYTMKNTSFKKLNKEVKQAKQVRLVSAASPLSDFAESLDAWNDRDTVWKMVKDSTRNNGLLNHTLVAFIFLQKVTGARVSELLNITRQNYEAPAGLILTGLKGSRDREVRVPELAGFLIDRFNRFEYLFAGLSYDMIRSRYKGIGIYKKPENSKNARITNALRARKVQDLQESNKKTETIRDVIGHNSIKSQEHYKQKNIKQKKQSKKTS